MDKLMSYKWTGGTPVLPGEGIQFFSGGSYKV